MLTLERYHIKTGFKQEHIDLLKTFTNKLNALNFSYSRHCLDNLKYRVINLEQLLMFIKNQELNFNGIFEYYAEGDYINKVCYRLKYTKNIDIILVLSDIKTIITIYLNSVDDEHVTLKKELYNQVDK